MSFRDESLNIYSRVSQSEEQKREAFLVYYKNYINIPLYKKDKNRYTKLIGEVELALKEIKDVNKSILVLCNKSVDKEVFLSLFSKKDKFTSNRYVNAQRIYDVFWDKCGKDNLSLRDDDIVYSTQDYNEDVLCIYISDDTYVRGVGPILNSLFDSRYSSVNYKGERKLSWVFYKGTYDSMVSDKDFKLVYNYFKSMSDTEDFIILDLNNGINLNTTISKVSNNKGTLGDIY